FNLAEDHLAAGAVDGDDITLADFQLLGADQAAAHVDMKPARTGDTGLAHAAGDNSGVAGHTAARGEDTGSGVHAVNILRAGFLAAENDFLALVAHDLRLVGAEDHGARSGTRRGRQAARNDM